MGPGSLKRRYLNEGLKGVSEVDIWKKTVLGEKQRPPRQNCAWHVVGIARQPCGCHQKMCIIII